MKAPKVLPGKCSTAVPIATGPTSSLCRHRYRLIGRPLYAFRRHRSALEAANMCFVRPNGERSRRSGRNADSFAPFPSSDHVVPAALRSAGDRVVKKLLAENFLGQLHTFGAAKF